MQWNPCCPGLTDRKPIPADVASAAQVDITRAYHFGARYNVEIEIILPGDMSVRESHDIALELQHKVRQESGGRMTQHSESLRVKPTYKPLTVQASRT